MEHKPQCYTNNLGTGSHPYQLGNGESPPKIQVLRCQPWANLASRPFIQDSYVNSLLCKVTRVLRVQSVPLSSAAS